MAAALSSTIHSMVDTGDGKTRCLAFPPFTPLSAGVVVLDPPFAGIGYTVSGCETIHSPVRMVFDQGLVSPFASEFLVRQELFNLRVRHSFAGIGDTGRRQRNNGE